MTDWKPGDRFRRIRDHEGSSASAYLSWRKVGYTGVVNAVDPTDPLLWDKAGHIHSFRNIERLNDKEKKDDDK